MLKLTQEQEQTLRLEMTPQMLQLFRLLQLSTLELSQLLAQELVENPMLEEVTPSLEEEVQSVDSEMSEEKLNLGETNIEENKEENKNDDEKEVDKALSEVNWDELFPDDRSWEIIPVEESTEEKGGYLANLATSNTETLEENLLRQISFLDFSDEERRIAEVIVGNIDLRGYLTDSLEEISKQMNISIEKVESILQIIQQLDPPGVGARNLQERILLELKQKNIQDALVYSVVNDYFVDLQYHRYQKIAKKLAIPLKKVQEIARLISSLDPNPARQFTNDVPHYIIPEVIVTKVDGDYQVRLNEESLPQLKISPVYQNMLKNKESLSPVEYNFLLKKFRAARDLVRNIERRQRIILQVAESIMKAQKEFLEKGIEYLKPLRLREIAQVVKIDSQKVGVHESTVARVTSNKYIQTPHGVFELKFFFSSGVEKQSGEGVSAHSIQELIAKIIQEEDPRKPYSDEKITELLRQGQGVLIARRTVSKYREEMKILPAYLRKRVDSK